MPDANDMDLVREFARRNSEPAFAELVRRHLNLVHSVALRLTGSAADAQDVTQAVFITLARRAAGLRERGHAGEHFLTSCLAGDEFDAVRIAATGRLNLSRHFRVLRLMRSEQVKLSSNSTVKSKLIKRIPAGAGLALVAALTLVTAVAARAADSKDRGIPAAALPAPPAVDPNTGLPLRSLAVEWKDPDWKDPDRVVEVRYDGSPLGEVARNLRDQFHNAFDVLLPSGWKDSNNSSEPVDPQSFPVTIQLKNVTASEVFNAMNLMFETENTPVRWFLKMNGKRPTAVLRVLPALLPAPKPPPEKERMVFFVGDLIGDGKSGGMTSAQIAETVQEVCSMALGSSMSNDFLQFHQGAQLLIVTGPHEEIRFVQDALRALKQKVELETKRKAQPTSGESKVKSEATKTP